MLDTLLLIAVGCFIGWNFPQPAYAKWIQNFVVTKFREYFPKKG